METKLQQIERLKDNRIPWKWLPIQDKEVFRSLVKKENTVYMSGRDSWDKCNPHDWSFSVVYRIHRDYQPDKPVFPGYELCEVKPDEDGNGHLRFWKDELWHVLDCAPRYGRAEYVFMEIPGERFKSPIMFIKLTNFDCYVPATLAYVALRRPRNEMRTKLLL